MNRQGAVELRSNEWLHTYASDRASFKALISRGFSTNEFQVFILPLGLLYLELKDKPRAGGNGASGAVVAGALLGGAVGALVCGALAQGAQPSSERQPEKGFDTCTDEELFSIAHSRQRSFVSEMDDIQSVIVEAPGPWGRAFGNSQLAGWVTLRDKRLGRIKMELRDQNSMAVVVEALPRRLGSRFQSCVEFHEETRQFLRKRAS